MNDKFIYDLKEKYLELKNQENLSEYLGKMSEDDYLMKIARLDAGCAKLKPQHLLENLFRNQNNDDFAKLFDGTLNDIAIFNNDIFSVHDQSGSSIRFFDEQLIQRASLPVDILILPEQLLANSPTLNLTLIRSFLCRIRFFLNVV